MKLTEELGTVAWKERVQYTMTAEKIDMNRGSASTDWFTQA